MMMHPVHPLATPMDAISLLSGGFGPQFSMHYYTRCALLKASCEPLKIHRCNIKICMLLLSYELL